MYYNEEHKNSVEKRGDGYTYIGSYKCNEITLDRSILACIYFFNIKSLVAFNAY